MENTWKITVNRPEGSAEVTLTINPSDDQSVLDKIQSALEAHGISVERQPA